MRKQIGATPYIWTHDGKKEIVTPGTGRVRSYDMDGKLLWEFRRHVFHFHPYAVFEPWTFVRDVGLRRRPGASRLCDQAWRSWRSDACGGTDQQCRHRLVSATAGPYNTSPWFYGDYYYTLLDRGFLTCHEQAPGKEIYGKQRMIPRLGHLQRHPGHRTGSYFC